ncbi:helix-turn-helix transcriptional regulator [Hyphomonas sp. FCG-A18]|jgi:transcriptional regulator with XRE-family HTH domain|uniref:helix-turn-helix domain-containing protein n=1 Tax=Hyphomonas sp. FCG-A18 TaxID=3080019 RepID=UPI002B2E747E|nr:helix-turn-helix transcriptional regulator [Hyphomonas sp. FCG-A18]
MTDLTPEPNTAPQLTASEVDARVGDRIRRRRILMGLTQDQLGEALGISYQQIQKYETGANRVSVGRLYLIAQRLEVNPGWFFDGNLSDASRADIDELGSSRLLMDFVRNFSRIEDDRLKTALVALVRAMAENEEAFDEDSVKLSMTEDSSALHP